MKVRSVVKVMNFHALLRVDASRRMADKYNAMQHELESMMKLILNNRNLRLDQAVKLPDKSKPLLRIYIGSDYGFCGSVNSSVSSMIAADRDRADRIVIGKRLRKGGEVLLSITEDELREDEKIIRKYTEEAIYQGTWSEIELCYNHYYNLSTITPIRRKIYPLDEIKGEEAAQSNADFLIEGDPAEILRKMTVAYLNCEILIAMHSAYASENVMRQNATNESLKKLDEIEAEEQRETRKKKNEISFRKTVDSYVKQKALAQK